MLVDNRERAPVYEIWTEHSVYEFDQSMRCTAVRDAGTGTVRTAEPLVGATLIGGRDVANQSVCMSYPLPAVGHRALLGCGERDVSETTPVMRIVMNLQRWSCKTRSIRSG